MNRFFKIAVAALIIVTAAGCQAIDTEYPKASDGILDLREWDFNTNGPADLDGEWEFYWKKLYRPDDFKERGFVSDRRIIKIPGSWNGYEIDGYPIGGEGYATFRLKILLPEDNISKSIRLSAISTAHRMWADGELVSALGEVATQREGSLPKYYPKVIPLKTEGDSIELVFQVSNFSHRRGGIWQSVTLGSSEEIQAIRERQMAVDMVLMGSLLITGLYHLALFLQRKKNRAPLFFGIFCILMGLRVVLVGQVLFLRFFPHLPQELALKLEYFTFYLALPFFVLYMHYLFPQEISKKAAISYLLTGSAFSLHVLLTPSRVYSYYLIIFQVITVGFLFYLLYSIIKAIIRKREGSFLVIVGFGVFFATAVNDILYYNEKSLMSDLAPLGVFIFIFVQSYILSSRFSRAFDTVEEMSNKLVEADKLKDEFLATVSHELLTPLNGMIGIAESTLQGSAGKLNQQQENNLNLIIYSGRRLSRLVDDLLDFSRIKNNDIVLNIEPVDLGQTVQRVLTLSRSLRSNKRLTLKSEIPEGLIVEADGNRLEQILYNLIGNAIKYTPSGSITVSASVKEKMAEISVRDTGIGIPEEYHDRIFELYERVESQNLVNTNGIGIGLSITKKLVELHGGNIWLKSEVGKGTEVTFTLSVSVQKGKVKTRIKYDSGQELLLPHPVSLPSFKEPDLEDAFRILVVDDEPVNIKVVASQLLLEHYKVTTVDNGMDALRKTEECPGFDLMILDIMLPDISGYDVCRLIRERYSLLELPVLMLTARNRPDDILLAFESGANDYLSKPFDRNEMLARVRTLIT